MSRQCVDVGLGTHIPDPCGRISTCGDQHVYRRVQSQCVDSTQMPMIVSDYLQQTIPLKTHITCLFIHISKCLIYYSFIALFVRTVEQLTLMRPSQGPKTKKSDSQRSKETPSKNSAKVTSAAIAIRAYRLQRITCRESCK